MEHSIQSSTYADSITKAFWYDRVIRDQLGYMRGDSWTTDGDIPDEWRSASVLENRAGTQRDVDLVFPLLDGFVRVDLDKRGNVDVLVAAKGQPEATAIWDAIRTALPKRKKKADGRIEVGFWFDTPHGPRREERRIVAPSWEEIADNYGHRTQDSLGRAMHDFRPSHGGQILLWHGEPGTGKCVARGTRVVTAWGDHRIEEMHPARTPDTAWEMVAEVGTPDGLKRTSHFYVGGEQATLKVTTRQGYEIEGTHEHPVLVLRPSGNIEWTRLCDIGTDDFLCVARGTSATWGNEHVPDAYVLGLLIGDGHVSSGRRVTLTTSDPEVALEWRDYAARHGTRAILRGSYDWSVDSTDLVRHLDSYGVRAVLAPDKVVPEPIWSAPERDVAAFLRGLFDADGSADTRGSIELSSTSDLLVREVQLLLLKFGIVGARSRRITHHDYRGERRRGNAFRLSITGEAAHLFYDRVGFGLGRKQQRQSGLPKVRNTNIDVVPYLRGRLIGFGHLGHPSYATVERLVAAHPENAKNATVAWSLAHHPFWSRVKTIVPSQAEVFDLTVPDGHSFIANGIVSHNTWALRALCREWREWCTAEYIVDPDNAFGENPAYLMQLLLGSSDESEAPDDGKAQWKLLILEDTGELIGEQAKAEAGQGLSRLLNVADGFLGQGLRVLVLITTNEEIKKLHPAVSRPGRAASVILFEPLTALEAHTWLSRHDLGDKWSPEIPKTLADLYAVAEQYPKLGDEKKVVGFRLAG